MIAYEMQQEKKSSNQGPWIRCGHCKKKFRSWTLLWKHWRLYCRIKPKGVPSIISCSVEQTYEMLEQRKEYAN